MKQTIISEVTSATSSKLLKFTTEMMEFSIKAPWIWDLKSCRLIASYKSNLLRKLHFLLKISLHVTVLFIILEDTLLQLS